MVRYVNILSLSIPYANATDTFFVLGNNLSHADSAYKADDSLVFYGNPPDNLYFNNQTYNPTSWLNFTPPPARNFSSTTIAVYHCTTIVGGTVCWLVQIACTFMFPTARPVLD